MNIFAALEADLRRQFGEPNPLPPDPHGGLPYAAGGSGPIPSPADSKDDEQGFVGGASYSRTER